MEQKIIDLQIIIEHQAADIASLSEELYAQQKELAALKRQFAELKESLKAMADEGGAVKDLSQETPPPHY
jgi:uncharacterized coiled-coil protein SlyX